MSDERNARHERLRERLSDLGADGFIIFSNEYDNRANIQYLSGFTGSAAVIVAGMKSARLVVDSRYFEQAEEESHIPVLRMADRDPWDEIKRAVLELGVQKMAFEEDKLSVKRHSLLLENGLKTVPVPQIVMQLRAVKGPEEIGRMRRACKIAACAFESIVNKLHIGMTERQMATLLADAMRARGADQLVKGHFVVASGPRGCRPHGVFSDRVVEDGDMVTFDFGAITGGYVSDMTRTLAFGTPGEKMLDIYDTALEANKLALASISSHVTGADVNGVVRGYLKKRGYDEYMKHAPGHGIGLELHELPNVNPANGEKLPAGAVVTVEPGVYLPGIGGVRIEDDVLVTENGCEMLTLDSSKGLRILV